MKDSLLQSLIYVSRYYGLANSPAALLSGLPLSKGKLTQFLLPRAAQRAGLIAQPQQHTQLSKISSLVMPVILILKDDESCVLLSFDVDNNRAEVVMPDGDSVQQWVDLEELNQLYTGSIFYLKRQFSHDDRSPELIKSNDHHWFWGTIWQSKSIYKDVFIASILINLFAIATPLFTRLVYDKVVPNLAFDSLWVLSSGIFIIFIFDLILKLLRSYFIDVAGKKSDILMSSRIFSKVMGIKMDAKPPSVGAFARHLQDFESIREFFTSATISSLIDLPYALLFLFIIYLMGGPLVYIPIVAVSILIIHSLLIQKPLSRSIEEGSRLASQKYANLIESLHGLETVKMFGAQSQFQYKWEEAVAHMSNWSIKTRRLTDSVQHSAGVIQQASSVAMIILGVYLIADGELTMGGLIASTMLSGRAIGPLVQLALLSTRYNQAKSAMTIIQKVMDMPDEQEHGKRYIHRPILSGKIQFNDVSFSYPDCELPSVKNITFTINPGEKVAIIGRIGAGKTTIERLLMGLYSPQSGSILLDDTDIAQLHHEDVRRNIGCVPQDLTLFYGTVRENITLGRPLMDDLEILEAANRAGVTNFTQKNPAGLERQVGEFGQFLSGGQRQAIAIARAFIGKPPILLMDEPTSNMDNRSEMFIKQQLSNLSEQETLIMITHKTSMLDIVDRIIVLGDGVLLADGSKDEILNGLKSGSIQVS